MTCEKLLTKNSSKRELSFGLSMLLVSSIAFYYANQLPDSRVFTVGGTGMIPFIMTASMIVLSLLKCLSALLGSHEQITIFTEKLNLKRSLILLLLVAIFAFCIEPFGFLLSSILLLLLVLPLFGLRKFKIGFVYAFGVSLATWLLFSKVFSSYLPSGTIF